MVIESSKVIRAVLKSIFFPLSLTTERLHLSSRWWHRALVVAFFLVLLPLFFLGAYLYFRLTQDHTQSIFLACMEQSPILGPTAVKAAQESDWNVRERAYDDFFASSNSDEFAQRLQNTPLAEVAKQDLWNAKYATTHLHPAVLTADKIALYTYVAGPSETFIEFPASMSEAARKAELKAKFDGFDQGWVDVVTPTGFTLVKLKDGISLYLHGDKLSASEVGHRVQIFRAAPAPNFLPANFFDKKEKKPVAESDSKDALDEEVDNPFQPNADWFDLVDAQLKRDSVRSTTAWKSCIRSSPSQKRARDLVVALLGFVGASYITQGLYRALLYVIFGS
jgi:hypothetical protein